MVERVHNVAIILSSTGKSNTVSAKVIFSDTESAQEIGYLPASWQALETYIVPALEEAQMDQHPELKENNNQDSIKTGSTRI